MTGTPNSETFDLLDLMGGIEQYSELLPPGSPILRVAKERISVRITATQTKDGLDLEIATDPKKFSLSELQVLSQQVKTVVESAFELELE